MLVCINRYPHALISCFASIESALKAFLKILPNSHPYLHFEDLKAKAKQKVGSFTINDSSLKDFREKRNAIIHYGFSPQDDKISAELLLDTGYLFIEECYEKFFDFSLTGQNQKPGGLLVDLAYHYNLAKKIREKSKNNTNHSSENCFVSFSHYIRWSIKDSMLSESDSSFLSKSAEEYDQRIEDFQNELKEEYDHKIFSSTWHFNCPICGNDESFICELDENELKNHQGIRFQRSYCVNCGFSVPKNCLYMTDELCKEQIDQQKNEILSAYGFSK
jgi:transcription elongation factor Elf1